MARRAASVCSRPGCPWLAPEGGRCPECRAEAEKKRGTASQRGYGADHRNRFRPGVLAKDPICKHPSGCSEKSTDADHFPLDRRELVRQGLDPNDPAHGRGLCGHHHKVETGARQPGGWNIR